MKNKSIINNIFNKSFINNFITIFILIVVIVLFNLLLGRFMEPFELKTLDFRLKLLSQQQKPDPRIVQLLLDDYSTSRALQAPELSLGRIPWQRQVWGEVVEFLNRGEPSAIVFDINYIGSEGHSPDNIASDKYFTDAVKNSKANVFFGILFTDSIASLGGNPFELEGEIIERLKKVPPDVLRDLERHRIKVTNNPPASPLSKIKTPETNKPANAENIGSIPPADLKPPVESGTTIVDNLDENSTINNFITHTVVIPIMKGLLEQGNGFGTINLKTDVDGVNRQHTPLFKYNNNFYPSLPFAVALSLLPKEERNLVISQNKLKIGKREITLDNEGKNLTTWYGPPKTYLVFHVIDAIESERALKAGETPKLDPSVFKDKIIVIGQTASGTDIHHTPIANVFVGTEVVATNIDNYLNQKVFLKRLDLPYTMIITFIFCVLIWLAVSKSKSIPGTVLLSSLIMIGYLFLTIYVMNNYKIWMDVIIPGILFILTFIVIYLIRFLFTHKQLESAIEEATKDGLTKLYNHRFFQEKIHKDLANASRKDDRVSLCLIDIDFFKKFNDTYGHRAGDAVLIQVAQTLKENVRKSDLVARYGGEEMCVLLDKTDLEDACLVAQKLVDGVGHKTFYINDGKDKVNVTISIGVATFPLHATTVPELIEFADKGLYRAKEGGRNQVGALSDELSSPIAPGQTKQIKEVEISKAKLVKVLEDFIKISQDKEYDYEIYLMDLLKSKEIFSQTFLDNLIEDLPNAVHQDDLSYTNNTSQESTEKV